MSGLTSSCRTTRTRYAIGTAANSPSARLHGVRVARRSPAPVGSGTDEERQHRAGDQHDRDVQREREQAQVTARQRGAAVERDVVGEEQRRRARARPRGCVITARNTGPRRAPELAPADLDEAAAA